MVEVITQAMITEKVEDREYKLYCSNSADLGEIYTVLHKMSGYILHRMQEVHKAQAPQDQQEETVKEA